MARRVKFDKQTAAKADKHALYLLSVQDPDSDIRFMDRVFKKERGRLPLTLREDFCGTAKLCADWVERKPDGEAWGLDLHGPTMQYGRDNYVKPLGERASRVHLLERDVLAGIAAKVDVAVAFNFSYCVFKDRKTLVRYYEAVRRGLGDDGVFFTDIHGGPDAQVEVVERTKHPAFTYVWEQAVMDAVSAHAMRYISFEFRDGTSLERAFSYDWRIWTLPELIDALYEAGFARVDTYWEGANSDGTGNGVFRKVKRADNEDSWIAYLAAWPR
ncbi:MAG: class I SAM-dependent methyltransferase [Myxococcota bacterium]|nr:class I SAM-dependent methyltransferase [Myxococcota bacterium]